MIKKIIFLVLVVLLVSSCTYTATKSVTKEPAMVNIFSNPENYLNQEVKFTAYVHNILSVCQASKMECFGTPVISPTSVYNANANIQVRDIYGNPLSGCEDKEEPCHGFVDGQKYLITGVLIKTEEHVINSKNLFNEFAVKVISKEEI